MSYRFVYLVLILSASIAKSEIVIKGNAPKFIGKTIYLWEYEDFFTRTRVERLGFDISEGGNFEFKYPLAQAGYLEISLNESFSGIYVRPGFEYQIYFDEKGKISAIESEDVTNTIVNVFEKEDFALFKFQRKKIYWSKIEEFVIEQNGKIKTYDEFLKSILAYRLARREFSLCKEKGDVARADKLEYELLLTKPILNNIPDYFGFLKAYSYDRQILFKLRRTPFDQQNFIKAFTNEVRAIPNDSIQQLAMLTVLEKAYQSDWGKSIDRDEINRLVDSLAQVAGSSQIKLAAKLVLRSNNSLKTGESIQDFSINTHDGQSLSLSSFSGKYVLIDFWFVGCSSCIENFPKLKQLKEATADKLEIISLSPYDTNEKITTFLRKRPKFDWIFAAIDRKGELLDYFNIMYYPTYFLISPSGKLVRRFTHGDLKDHYKVIEELISE
jgi:peroxiredoxin